MAHLRQTCRPAGRTSVSGTFSYGRRYQYMFALKDCSARLGPCVVLVSRWKVTGKEIFYAPAQTGQLPKSQPGVRGHALYPKWTKLERTCPKLGLQVRRLPGSRIRIFFSTRRLNVAALFCLASMAVAQSLMQIFTRFERIELPSGNAP